MIKKKPPSKLNKWYEISTISNNPHPKYYYYPPNMNPPPIHYYSIHLSYY